MVSYRLIDDAAGSKPPSIQEARTGNRESGKSGNNATKSGSGLDGGEPISGSQQEDGQPQTKRRDPKEIPAAPISEHRPQYGTGCRVEA